MQENRNSVTLCPAMFGVPADVRVIADGQMTIRHFCVGHVFTDNTNAAEYAERMAATLGVAVEHEA